VCLCSFSLFLTLDNLSLLTGHARACCTSLLCCFASGHLCTMIYLQLSTTHLISRLGVSLHTSKKFVIGRRKEGHCTRLRTNTWGCDSVAYARILLADKQRERRDVPGVRTSEITLDFQTTRAKHAYVAQNGVHIEGIYC
jgi:hypothetical protein